MDAWFETLSAMDRIFLLSAILGGTLFVLWLVMQLVGGGDGDAHAEFEPDLEVSGEADISFKVLSFQVIASFLTMFGLVGLAVNRESQAGPFVATLAAVAAGSATVELVRRIFGWFTRLQSSGTMRLESTIGEEGTVYLRLKPGGVGKVQMNVSGHLKVFDAQADTENVVETGQRVRVLRVVSGNILVVEKV